MPLNPKKRQSKKRTSKKRKSYKKKTPQSGGAFTSSPDGFQPPIKTGNKTLRYTRQSSIQRQIGDDIEKLSEKVNTLHTIGGIITNPYINQFATTEGNIKVIKKIIENLSKILPEVKNKLQAMLQEGEGYIKQRDEELSRKGLLNHDESLKKFWEKWQKNKKSSQKTSNRSRRKTLSKSK